MVIARILSNLELSLFNQFVFVVVFFNFDFVINQLNCMAVIMSLGIIDLGFLATHALQANAAGMLK